jgi:N-methylhydantoinase B/oxoprolinase/acetone carboxylase alpha subunit
MSCENIEAIKATLVEADLVTGSKVRMITDSNGERVEFQSANSSKLYSYIADLEAQVAACASGSRRVRGPAGFIF